MITETDEIARALDAAAKLHPELSNQRAELLRELILEGSEALTARHNTQVEARTRAVHAIAGSLDGVWPKNWRDELRDEWPA